MSDLIKRSDAIEAIHNYWKKCLDTLPTADIQQMDKILEHNKTLCNFINAIPSTDRPQGSWKEDYNGGGFKEWLDITCSLCGETLHDIQKNPKDYKHCPFCGAKMKGADYE